MRRFNRDLIVMTFSQCPVKVVTFSLNGIHDYFEVMVPIDELGFYEIKYYLSEMFMFNCVQIRSNNMTRGADNVSRVGTVVCRLVL